MSLFNKKPQLVLITSHAPVHEKIKAVYGSEFSIQLLTSETEFSKFYAKQSKKRVSAILYDGIEADQEEVLEFFENFNRKFNEPICLILAEQKLKDEKDYEFLEQIYRLYDEEELEGIINFKKEKSFPKAQELLGNNIDEVTHEEFENLFSKVYQNKPEEKTPVTAPPVTPPMSQSPSSIAQGNMPQLPEKQPPVDSERSPIGASLPEENTTKSQLPPQGFTLPNGEGLSGLIDQQLSSEQKEELGHTEPSGTDPSSLPDKKIEGQEQSSQLLRLQEDLKASQDYAEETYQLATTLSQRNEELERQLEEARATSGTNGTALQLTDFLSTMTAQQKQLQSIKESFDASALEDIERLKKENSSLEQSRKDSQRRLRKEREKVQVLEENTEKLLQDNQDLQDQIADTQVELEENKALVAQFKAFQEQFAAMFSSPMVSPKKVETNQSGTKPASQASFTTREAKERN